MKNIYAGIILLLTITASHTRATPGNYRPLSKTEYAKGYLRQADVIKRMRPRLSKELSQYDLKLGSQVFIRIFKESRELEIWVLHEPSQKFRHFKTWPIAAMSGKLGPKTAEGDLQAPEGFYYVGASRMKPDSRYHLAFNIGYPNRYDLEHGRTGSYIMVHGNQVSIGCYAMTDPYIEEIYTLCTLALNQGQRFFRVHSFPFRMDAERMKRAKNNTHYPFWLNLKEGYDWFEKYRTPPNVQIKNKSYLFE